MKTKLVAFLSLLAGLNAKFTVPHLNSRVVIIAQSTAWINSQRGLLLCSGLLTSLLLLSSLPVQASNESTATDHQELLLSLNTEQRQLAGIEVSELSLQAFNLQAVATAQLIVDKDKTITIAPQLDMQILKRHVVPGEQVTQGQPLLTIGGADIAAAQADYINAATEWDRIKRMTPGTISASQRMQIEVNAELKRAILQAIMMTPAQIKALAKSPSSIGQFQLLAPINGRVQQDVATLGQVLDAGTPLMQLTDESYLWVQAELTPLQADQVDMGRNVLVRVGDRTRDGIIIGRSHEISAQTRTEQVLVRMANPGHELHAGEFAELYLAEDKQVKSVGFIVPDAALTRSGDGDWQVFIEQEGKFSAVEVTVVERQRGLSFIRGLTPKTRVVISGAFFLASEQAKAGFDIHNH
ncbi:efflux RND transporter periplasmic adaptor subunit [Shewanella sp. SR43-8]|uniref:efflux RND transporter periplasmic adaptor subunit n=1 Tax=Shewanella sp. SR43-8 TaxID=2760938 RepID=UPI0016041079|nr:efflux RND transporter periplasmic adaptor subunit [Shewanella sp. SR43-8]MBB1321081.1 efflux RND transporter periplasmic adaptor subunit [Shewanella sp. SR43-8]